MSSIFQKLKEKLAHIRASKKYGVLNPVIQMAIANIQEGKHNFEFILRDPEFNRDFKFKVEISPMAEFILGYCNRFLNPVDLKICLKVFEQLDDALINGSFAIFEQNTSGFNALQRCVNPRFVLHVNNEYCLEVFGTDGYEEASVKAARKVYEKYKEFKLTKETVLAALPQLIENQPCHTEQPSVNGDVDKYVQDYLPRLEQLLEFGGYRIHFHGNNKYNCRTFGIYYIGFDDMYAYKLNIREKAGEDYNDSSDPIIAQYASPIEILKDGWRLD